MKWEQLAWGLLLGSIVSGVAAGECAAPTIKRPVGSVANLGGSVSVGITTSAECKYLTLTYSNTATQRVDAVYLEAKSVEDGSFGYFDNLSIDPGFYTAFATANDGGDDGPRSPSVSFTVGGTSGNFCGVPTLDSNTGSQGQVTWSGSTTDNMCDTLILTWEDDTGLPQASYGTRRMRKRAFTFDGSFTISQQRYKVYLTATDSTKQYGPARSATFSNTITSAPQPNQCAQSTFNIPTNDQFYPVDASGTAIVTFDVTLPADTTCNQIFYEINGPAGAANTGRQGRTDGVADDDTRRGFFKESLRFSPGVYTITNFFTQRSPSMGPPGVSDTAFTVLTFIVGANKCNQPSTNPPVNGAVYYTPPNTRRNLDYVTFFPPNSPQGARCDTIIATFKENGVVTYMDTSDVDSDGDGTITRPVSYAKGYYEVVNVRAVDSRNRYGDSDVIANYLAFTVTNDMSTATMRKRKLVCDWNETICPRKGINGKSVMECVADLDTNIERCGTCNGPDCTEIPHVGIVSCVEGRCEIASCQRGYTIVNNSCVKAQSLRKRKLSKKA